ncbi:hypothetical protein X801_03864, partial [Opisthorchis viverrini]
MERAPHNAQCPAMEVTGYEDEKLVTTAAYVDEEDARYGSISVRLAEDDSLIEETIFCLVVTSTAQKSPDGGFLDEEPFNRRSFITGQ